MIDHLENYVSLDISDKLSGRKIRWALQDKLVAKTDNVKVIRKRTSEGDRYEYFVLQQQKVDALGESTITSYKLHGVCLNLDELEREIDRVFSPDSGREITEVKVMRTRIARTRKKAYVILWQGYQREGK